MTKPSVSQERMLDILDAVWKDCYQKEFEALRALILAVEEWGKRAGIIYEDRDWDKDEDCVALLKDIRDFGEGE